MMNVTMDTISTHNVPVSIKIVFIKLVLKKPAINDGLMICCEGHLHFSHITRSKSKYLARQFGLGSTIT